MHFPHLNRIATTLALLALGGALLAARPAMRDTNGVTFHDTPSSNFRPTAGRTIDTIVIHYMSAINVDPDRWDDPALARQILAATHVSAHYLIDRDGEIYRLVREEDVAWHAGGSIMPAPDNRRNVNGFSIGIETIATDTSGFTNAQYHALARLIADIETRHPIRHLLGHDQIAGQRAVALGLRHDLKPDPGPLFDWAKLRALLHAGAGEEIRHRRVRLMCGSHRMSEADNWYLPSRLTPAMNQALDTTDTSFGTVVRPLDFHRQTLEAKPLRNRHAALEITAVLIAATGVPFSLVVEDYANELVTGPAR